jgi:hypothetical protein
VVWAVDDEPRSISDLSKRVVDEATHLPPRSDIWGPNWLVDSKAGAPPHKLADSLDQSGAIWRWPFRSGREGAR